MQLSSTRREIELGRHLARDFDNLTRIGATLMDKRDGLDVTFEKVNGLLGDIDALVNQQILHVAPTPEPMRRRTLAALANVEAEAAKLGFWLSAYERRPTALTTRQLLERAAKLGSGNCRVSPAAVAGTGASLWPVRWKPCTCRSSAEWTHC